MEEGTVDGDSHAVESVELDVLGVGVGDQLVVQFEGAHWAPGRLVMAGSSLTDPLPARLSREERPASRSALRWRRRSHRDGEAGGVCVAHCGADVRRAEAAGDKSGVPVVYSIPHRADVVVSQVP